MKLSFALPIALVALASVTSLEAQDRQKSGESNVPANERPPAGMCRIWLDDVPATQQPAPTDCATAVRNRPAKGRVIFGDDYASAKRDESSKGKAPVKGFAPSVKASGKPLKKP